MTKLDKRAMKIKIDVRPDLVIVEGIEVRRPAKTSRSDWLDSWEKIAMEYGE